MKESSPTPATKPLGKRLQKRNRGDRKDAKREAKPGKRFFCEINVNPSRGTKGFCNFACGFFYITRVRHQSAWNGTKAGRNCGLAPDSK